MPLFEFQCSTCGHRVERLYSSYASMQRDNAYRCTSRIDIDKPQCTGFLERVISAPSFKVTGFNQRSGYASEQVRIERKNGIRTEVRGNFEAFDLKA